VDPLKTTDDPRVAAVKRPTVATCMRRGVSQVACWAWSQLRAPAAPVIAAIAHIAHIVGAILMPRLKAALQTPLSGRAG
jgi:hypothetical protein